MPWPEPMPMGRVTPTSGEALRACALRVAYSLDKTFDWLNVPSTWSILGSATHRVCEVAAGGGLSGCSSQEAAKALAQHVWDCEVLTGQKRLLESSAVLVPAPAVERWPGYQLSRTRAVRRALQDYVHEGTAPLSVTCQEEVETRLHGVEPPSKPCRQVEVEIWPEDAEQPLAGRIDRLESYDDQLELYDLKSAVGGHDGLRPSHRRQLLVYSYLVHRVRGSWPVTAGVRYLDGQEDVIDVVPAEAQATAFEYLSLLEDYNKRVTSCGTCLAEPSSDTCIFCDYKCLCEPFFDGLTPEWGGPQEAVLGKVISVESCNLDVRLQLHARACSLEAESGEIGVRGLPERLRRPRELSWHSPACETTSVRARCRFATNHACVFGAASPCRVRFAEQFRPSRTGVIAGLRRTRHAQMVPVLVCLLSRDNVLKSGLLCGDTCINWT